MLLLTERYETKIAGVLSCLDRVVITGILPSICYAEAATNYLKSRNIRIFDYPKWAQSLRDEIRQRASHLAQKAKLTIHHQRKANEDKEDYVAQVLQSRGDHPGLVCIISAMERCPTYEPASITTSISSIPNWGYVISGCRLGPLSDSNSTSTVTTPWRWP